MSATLREYKSGRLRKRLWLRYDAAVRVLVEYAEKFEADEQPGADQLFRSRYRPVLELLQRLTQETRNGMGDRAGANGADVQAGQVVVREG